MGSLSWSRREGGGPMRALAAEDLGAFAKALRGEALAQRCQFHRSVSRREHTDTTPVFRPVQKLGLH